MTDTLERLPESTVLVGRTKTGKSTSIAEKIEAITADAPDTKVLWMSFDNTKVFSVKPHLRETWNVQVIATWEQFEKLKDALVDGKIKADIIVIDGIAALARLNQDFIAPNGQMSQPQWGTMSKNVHRAIRALRDVADVYATILLKEVDYAPAGHKPDIVVQYDLNQDLQKRVLPEFGTVLYCHYEDTDAGRQFFVMDNSVFAFQS